MIIGVLAALSSLALVYSVLFILDIVKHRETLEQETRFSISGGIGFLTNFLDTLGIGSFAPMTALLRGFKQIQDRVIPGTLNVSCTIPVVAEAFIFITVIQVEMVTLIAMVVTAIIGTVLGAAIISKLPENKIQIIMAIALFATAFFMIAGQFGWIAGLGTGTAIGLTGVKLIIAVVVNFFLGAFQAAGIGMYAPSMALVYILGMAPRVAFPIMMSSSAFTLPPASMKYIKTGAYNRKASLAISIAGIVGVFIAAFIVKSLPVNILIWFVITAILYAAVTLLMASRKK